MHAKPHQSVVFACRPEFTKSQGSNFPQDLIYSYFVVFSSLAPAHLLTALCAYSEHATQRSGRMVRGSRGVELICRTTRLSVVPIVLNLHQKSAEGKALQIRRRTEISWWMSRDPKSRPPASTAGGMPEKTPKLYC